MFVGGLECVITGYRYSTSEVDGNDDVSYVMCTLPGLEVGTYDVEV